MSRRMVGLLAAAGAAMSALTALTHGDSVPLMIAGAAGATGLATYLAAPAGKSEKGSIYLQKNEVLPNCSSMRAPSASLLRPT
jgi:hypothetical protein